MDTSPHITEPPNENHSLVQLDEATRMLSQINSVDEVKSIRDKAEAMRVYAKQAKLGLAAQNHAAEIKIRAERRAGELLKEMDKHEGGRPSGKTSNIALPVSPPTLSEIGISKMQSSRWQDIASIPHEQFEAVIESVKTEGETELTTAGLQRLTTSGTHIVQSSESNEYYTPQAYIFAARRVLHAIDLDPASCEVANHIVQAAKYYTAQDDGLKKSWSGNVWLNPPYGGFSASFSAKLLDEYKAGRVKQAIMLVNANVTDTKWFAPFWNYLICFTNHRINFILPENVEEKSGSTHGSIFVYLGLNGESFIQEFKQFGVVVRRVDK